MQWRKLFDHNPLFATFCDKLATREWVGLRATGLLGTDLEFAELLWTGGTIDALPMHLLKGDVVLKVSSGSGANYFPDRQDWDRATLRRRFSRWLRRPRRGVGEWAYGQLPARLLVERLHGSPDEMVDLTFRCHNGHVASAFAAFAWKTEHARTLYLSPSGIPLFEPSPELAAEMARKLPAELFDRAAAIARHLSLGIDHVRVDLQLRGDHIYFGEVTVYSSSGFGEEERVGIGPMIERQWVAEIECSWFLSTAQPWPISLYQGAFRRWVRRRQLALALSQQRQDAQRQDTHRHPKGEAEARPAMPDRSYQDHHEGPDEIAIGDRVGRHRPSTGPSGQAPTTANG